MSHSTEQDLLAIAEMLSPAVEAGAGEEEPIPEGPPMAELESFTDMFPEDTSVPNPARDSVSSTMSSLYSSYRRESSVGASTRGSIYTDSDGASYFGDDLPDPSLLAAPFLQHGLRNFHLPRGSLPMPPLDDTRSLSSSTSYSSLRTPSLSRASSVAYLNSPPISPTSSYSPVDGPGPSSPHTSMQNSNSKLLGIIEEHFHSEEGHGHTRRTSEATETITLDECFEETRFSQSSAPTAYQDRRQPPRTSSREEMRGPVRTLYKSDSKSELRSSGARSDVRTEMRSPPRSPPPSRRLPEVQKLKISPGASSISSAPVLDISASSPFSQQAYAQQSRSAHPSTQRTLPFAPEPRSAAASYTDKRSGFVNNRAPPFSDEEQSAYAREMQSPFGKVPKSYQTEQYSSGYGADLRSPHTPDTPASFQTMRSPTFAHPEAERNVQMLQQKPERIAPPPPPPVPPSPVLSATSSSSSHKSKKGVGLGKFFGKNGDKSSKKSSEGGSTFSSGQSVSSLELGSSKDEVKRLKREAAKARTERLAQDLAEKTRRRAEAAKAQKGSAVRERSKKPWEEGAGGLYEGISYF
ncbi:hypothetical protein OH76DRAFT_1458753 [Lentinus brumalis]|uniref:Uncharacterized protein n=1 Tax=Lentinus brumalis TaxID=2498619 RepID=A0A371CQD1_9APHY|nr:hypothetical protein OH76DRAFT_1458753 [Polyporus brumalis]